MDADLNIAAVASLIGDPTRARMLTALMDGRARTAKELAYGAAITPQTASSHLAKLLEARLLDGLRLARTCYDHLAGRLGVRVTDAMVRRQLLKPTGRDFLLTASGARFLGRLGVDVEKARKERRAFARQCLDWSERRAHLAGALGAAVARRCLDLRWAAPVAEERTLRLTPPGLRGLRTWFGIKWKY